MELVGLGGFWVEGFVRRGSMGRSPSEPKIAETLSMTFLVPNKAILNAN